MEALRSLVRRLQQAIHRLVQWALKHPIRNGILFATLIALPTIFSGWFLDDWTHRSAILHRIPIHDADPLSLFTFGEGDRDRVLARTQFGYGWWTAPDLRLKFLRPLSAWTHLFDEHVLGPHAELHHLQSLCWQALGILAAGLLFRRLLSRKTADIATLLYAIDESHWTATSWLSNRNAWVSIVPAMFGLWAWLKAEQEKWPLGHVLAPLLFALGLCGGETALGILAIWLCISLGRQKIPLLNRLLTVLPLLMVTLAWAIYYRLHHYGAASSGAYLDPATDPLRYLSYAIHRVPSLAGALVASLPVEIQPMLPLPGMIAMALLGAWVTWLLLRALARADLHVEDRAHLWPLAIGGFLALFPPAATWPAQRTLLAPSLVCAALVAMILPALTRQIQSGQAPLPTRLGQRSLVFLHTMYAPLVGFLISLALLGRVETLDALAHSPALQNIQGKHVVLLVAPDPVLGFYLPSLLGSAGQPLPAQYNALGVSVPNFETTFSPKLHNDVQVRRTGPNRLELTALGAEFVSSAVEHLLIDPRHMPKAGDTLQVPHLKVHILEADAVGIRKAEFEFEQPLENLVILRWHAGKLERVPPPGPELQLLAHERGVVGM